MQPSTAEVIDFHDFHPQLGDLRREVLEGLHLSPKRIPPKFFYDKRGSQLFDQICALEEYYPTRTEIGILKENAGEIAGKLTGEGVLIEYGSGSSTKIRILLDAIRGRGTYIAIDISKQHLIESATQLAKAYPELEVIAICADYMKPFPLPHDGALSSKQKVAFFPGSTIGNFEPQEAAAFLRTTANRVGLGGAMLLGVDLKKDARILHAAYNDSEGVTAEFNLNLLVRINRELGADFDLSAFRHRAFYNDDRGRVEMHLESLMDQTVSFNGLTIKFREGETIHTENSYKYGIEELHALAAQAGFQPVRVWTDPDCLFSLHYLTVKG